MEALVGVDVYKQGQLGNTLVNFCLLIYGSRRQRET
jgi:hypothetical protein